jgi:hypothetical protein
MKTSVELIYKAMPSDRELKTIQEAGHMLTSNQKSVSVQVLEKDGRYTVLLEFTMPTEAQYKVVDRVSDEVQRWLMESYENICIGFGKQ